MWADHRGMSRTRRQYEPVTGFQLDLDGVFTHDERDRPFGAHEQLCVGMVVRDVGVSRTVAPRMGRTTKRCQPLLRRGHAWVAGPRPQKWLERGWKRRHSIRSTLRWRCTSPSSREIPTIRSSGTSQGRISVM